MRSKKKLQKIKPDSHKTVQSQFWISEPLGGEDEETDKNDERIESDSEKPSDLAGYEAYDPIDIVLRFRDLRRVAGSDEKSRENITDSAIDQFQSQAREFRKNIHEPKKKIQTTDSSFELNEIDWESTLETFAESTARQLSRDHYEWQASIPKDVRLLVIMDLSLSIKGEKLAMITTAVTSLALSLKSEKLAILGFDSNPTWIKTFEDTPTERELIHRIISYPASGFTNIEAALIEAREQIPPSAHHKTQALLITDGTYTEGASPIALAHSFHRLHTLSVGKNVGGRELLARLADAGNGEIFEARDLTTIPSTLLKTARAILK